MRQVFLILSSFIWMGCNSPSPKVSQFDEKEISQKTVHWSPYIEQLILSDIVSKMLKSKELSKDRIYLMKHIYNNTLDTHADTELLAKSIMLELSKSAGLQFIEYRKEKPNFYNVHCEGVLTSAMQNSDSKRFMVYWLDLTCTDMKDDTIIGHWRTKKFPLLLKKTWKW